MLLGGSLIPVRAGTSDRTSASISLLASVGTFTGMDEPVSLAFLESSSARAGLVDNVAQRSLLAALVARSFNLEPSLQVSMRASAM
jgi:hypothetical protein